jgi:hypothetical protein
LSRDDVKIVVLRNLQPNEDHAAVAARLDGQWLILDSRRLALVRDTEMVGSIPKFVLDEEGTRRFVPSNRAGQGPCAGRLSPARFVRRLGFGARKPPLSAYQPIGHLRAGKENGPSAGASWSRLGADAGVRSGTTLI